MLKSPSLTTNLDDFLGRAWRAARATTPGSVLLVLQVMIAKEVLPLT